MTTLFVNNLTIIDASFLDPERGLLGESWQVDVELEGSLNHQGMVLDFGDVKQQVKQIIDGHFDHKLLVPTLHPGCRVEHQAQRTDLHYRLDSGQEIRHSAPANATTQIQTDRITNDALAEAIIKRVLPYLPDNVQRLRIHLRHENGGGTFFHYSHGLKHHAGNCQRIAHGHRSRLEIHHNGEPAHDLEQLWSERWRDIYIATATDLLGEFERGGTHYYRFGYTSEQGLFELELPQSRCYIIDSDSTIENLAQHIAEQLKQEQPDAHFLVRAFEGVDKGALGEA